MPTNRPNRPANRPTPQLRLTPWAADDLPLLREVNTPEMRAHLGGPESEAAVAARHVRYLDRTDPAAGCMFRIAVLPGDEPAGVIGYWETEWRGEAVYETGWGVLPRFQGRGIAVAAAAQAVEWARDQRRHARIHAFPATGNPGSNAICRRLGFTLAGECEIEYPPATGNIMRCNDWSLPLT